MTKRKELLGLSLQNPGNATMSKISLATYSNFASFACFIAAYITSFVIELHLEHRVRI